MPAMRPWTASPSVSKSPFKRLIDVNRLRTPYERPLTAATSITALRAALAPDFRWRNRARVPEDEPSALQTLEASSEYDVAEMAIKEVIIPIVNHSMDKHSWMVMLVRFRQEPSILVVSSKPDLFRDFLQATYGGLPVVVCRGCLSMRSGTMHNTTVTRCLKQQIGASLGPAHSAYSGSLGLYVRCKTTGKIGALTCAHVVEEGTGGDDTSNSNQEGAIHCPSDQDIASVVESLEQKIKKDETSLESAKLNDDAIARRNLLQRIADDTQAIQTLQQKRLFGRVITRVIRFPNRLMRTYFDCAILEVERPDEVTAEMNTADHQTKAAATFLDPDSLTSTDVLIKQGRTTGLTVGKVNGYKANLGLDHPNGTAYRHEAYAVWNEESGKEFSAGGDSGAAILTQADNQVVGILYGGGAVEVESTSGSGTLVVDMSFFCSIIAVAAALNVEPLRAEDYAAS